MSTGPLPRLFPFREFTFCVQKRPNKTGVVSHEPNLTSWPLSFYDAMTDAMTDNMNIWCYVEGKPTYLVVNIPPGDKISDLIQKMPRELFPPGTSNWDLILTKVNGVELSVVEDQINHYGKFHINSTNVQRRLWPREIISEVWPEKPLHDHLQVFASSQVEQMDKKIITPPTETLDIDAIDQKINMELDSIRGMIKTFLENPEPPTWIPPNSVTQSNRKFLADLQIPSYNNGTPSLLFHNLDKCDDELIKMIFGPGAHKFICNTSGSGKTRRMLEGLTKYWGFYIVATPDVSGVGVQDLKNALDGVIKYSKWVPDLRSLDESGRAVQNNTNRFIVSKQLRKVLAARAVVFQQFVQLAIEVDGTLQEKHKRLWLLFQLSDRPVASSRGSHPFVRIITRCLPRASDEVLDILVERLDDILYDYLTDSHFIFGLDEAQRASRLYPRCFISSTDSNTFRSIIRGVVEVFTKSPIKLIVSGTGLSLADLQDNMTSGVSKPATVEVYHALGMFDTWEKLEPFLARYIPASFLASPSGKLLTLRMQEYLLGRYRFSVSFVEHLLRNGLESPHKLFNHFINEHVGCPPGDSAHERFTENEKELQLKFQIQGFEWDKFKNDSSAISEAVRIVQSHLLKGQSPTYGVATAHLVEYGIARLRKTADVYEGEIVEPLPFLSLIRWLQTAHEGHLSIQANLRLELGNQGARGGAFEQVGVLYLLRVLRYPVSFTTVFDFHSRFIPSWAEEKGHIVACRDHAVVAVDVLGEAPENPGLAAVQYASSIEDIINWVDVDELGTTTAVLITKHLFGPDVMVRCHIPSTDTAVLLMGQFKSYTVGNHASLDATTNAEAVTSLDPDHWFKKAPSNQRQKLIDAIKKHQVLRFIRGYPLPPNLNLNAESVKQAVQALDPNVPIATFKLDEFRAKFKSKEEKNIIDLMDHALDRKRKLHAIGI